MENGVAVRFTLTVFWDLEGEPSGHPAAHTAHIHHALGALFAHHAAQILGQLAAGELLGHGLEHLVLLEQTVHVHHLQSAARRHALFAAGLKCFR